MTLSNVAERAITYLTIAFFVLIAGCQSNTTDQIDDTAAETETSAAQDTVIVDSTSQTQDRLKVLLAKASAAASAGRRPRGRRR